jgi:hypothetical protein
MKKDNLAALARKVSVTELAANRTLSGGRYRPSMLLADRRFARAAEGERTVAMIRGGTPEARNPLTSCRGASARARWIYRIPGGRR